MGCNGVWQSDGKAEEAERGWNSWKRKELVQKRVGACNTVKNKTET